MQMGMQIKSALNNLFATKMRSFLAALGILVGTGSVVAMVSGGELATYQAMQQFRALGTNLLAVSINSQQSSGGSNASGKLTLQTANNTLTASNQIATVAPYITMYQSTSFNGHPLEGSLIGATRSLAYIMKLKMMHGRFISALDKYSSYCTIGQAIYKQIKKYDPYPIGKQIQIGSNYFTIIGIVGPWIENSFVYANLNQAIFIPVPTTMLIDKYANIYNIVMKLKDKSSLPNIEKGLRGYFKKHTKGKQLYFRSAAQILKSMQKQKQILTIFLGLIGSVSLLVGGIGIMNIMLVSVAERRNEIGLRMALGARRRDIQILFLIESIILSLFGGLVGVMSGVTIAYSIALIKHWRFVFFFFPPTIGFIVATIVGIFFGFYPAYKASKMNPIEALRTE